MRTKPTYDTPSAVQLKKTSQRFPQTRHFLRRGPALCLTFNCSLRPANGIKDRSRVLLHQMVPAVAPRWDIVRGGLRAPDVQRRIVLFVALPELALGFATAVVDEVVLGAHGGGENPVSGGAGLVFWG